MLVESTTGETLRSPTVSTNLQRLAAQAAQHPDRVFTTLAHLIAKDFLQEASHRTCTSSAPGSDGVTAQAYAAPLDTNLQDLYERLRSGRYQAPPVERVWRTKEEGGQRPIGQPACEDTMVQRAVVRLLAAIDAHDVHDGSYGLRRGRSPHGALRERRAPWLDKPMGWSGDAESSGGFDSMDRARLQRVVRDRINDGRI